MEIKNPNEVSAQKGEMLLARVYVRFDKDGTGVFRDNVTPAEAAYLEADGRRRVNDRVLMSIEVTGKVKRSRMEELSRLRQRFQTEKLVALYGQQAPLPETYEEALEVAGTTTLPKAEMFITDLAAS